jgi:hypothetical protein
VALQHLPSIDLRGPALLLGPGGDLELVAPGGVTDGGDPAHPVAVTLATGDIPPDRLGPAVVLVHLGPAAAQRHAVIDAVGRGVAAVIAGPLDEALGAADALIRAGADPTRVAVEVTVGPGPAGPDG